MHMYMYMHMYTNLFVHRIQIASLCANYNDNN